jgi:hypothetical protein
VLGRAELMRAAHAAWSELYDDRLAHRDRRGAARHLGEGWFVTDLLGHIGRWLAAATPSWSGSVRGRTEEKRSTSTSGTRSSSIPRARGPRGDEPDSSLVVPTGNCSLHLAGMMHSRACPPLAHHHGVVFFGPLSSQRDGMYIDPQPHFARRRGAENHTCSCKVPGQRIGPLHVSASLTSQADAHRRSSDRPV